MPTPNFHDLSDGSSIINYAGHDFDDLDIIFDDPAPAPPPQLPPPQTATQVNEAQRAARRSQVEDLASIIETPRRTERRPRARRVNRRDVNPDAAIRKDPNAWSLREAVELCKLLEVVIPEAGFHIALTGGLLYKEGRRKDCDLMFYQIRQVEPNYEVLWKYLTVAGVIRHPGYVENGWLVKATYRGKQVDCLFPNAKKAKKAGAAKEDCYKAAPPTPPTPDMEPPMTMMAAPAPPITREGYIINPAWEAGAPVLVRHNDGAPILYRRSPDAPGPYDPAELLATPAPAPSDPRPTGVANSFEELRAEVTAHIELHRTREAPVPPAPRDFIDRSFAAQRRIRAERQAEAIPACVQEEAFRPPTSRELELLRNSGVLDAPTSPEEPPF